jgi:hypothetical protein
LFLTFSSIKKAITLTSGLQADAFFDTWVLTPGHASIDVKYRFLKQTQMCELLFRQRAAGHIDLSTRDAAQPVVDKGSMVYRGSLTVWIQEADGFHKVVVRLDGPHVVCAIPMTYNLKCRRSRWKRVICSSIYCYKV